MSRWKWINPEKFSTSFLWFNYYEYEKRIWKQKLKKTEKKWNKIVLKIKKKVNNMKNQENQEKNENWNLHMWTPV